jgi:KH/beta-lactamase-domain protein
MIMGLQVTDIQSRIARALLENVPADAKITRVDFEGPYLVLYTENIKAVTGEEGLAAKIAKAARRKVIIRPAESIRLPVEKAKEFLLKNIPSDVGLQEIYFDELRGEVHIYALKLGQLIGRGGMNLWMLMNEIRWKIIPHRAPAMKSDVFRVVSEHIISSTKEHVKTLMEIGQRLNRMRLYQDEYIRIVPLGGFGEVGRSSILIETPNSKVLLDAGAKPGAKTLYDEYPAFHIDGLNIEDLDAIVISHAHFDHTAALPYLFKYGYRGPVYMTEPTLHLTYLIIKDYLDVALKEGRPLPYTMNDVRTMMQHVITIDYEEVVDIAPDIKLTLYNAGHILGSSSVHLHIGEGLHNIVYSGDFKFANTRLLNKAFNNFKRVETLIIESTYGAPTDVMPTVEETEETLIKIVKDTLERGGKVLMPMLSVGRAQEVMLALYEAIENNKIPKIPIYVEGMILESTALHTAFLDELSWDIKNKVFKEGVIPFKSDYFYMLHEKIDRSEIVEGSPCIIIAPSGMLTGGPALEYLCLLANDEKSTVVFTSYQVSGTLGRSLKDGIREVMLPDEKGVERLVTIKMDIQSVEGFSGHSDRKQLLNYIRTMPQKPRLILVNHGEYSKSVQLANAIEKMFNIRAIAPNMLEAIKVH